MVSDVQFKKKIDRARKVELEILKWYKKNYDPDVKMTKEYHSEYDIISPLVDNIEVKEDRMAVYTGNYAIEFENGLGQPSGLGITTAGHYVLVDYKNVVIMATESLKYILSGMKYKSVVNMGYKTLEGKTAKGWLLPKDKVLASGLAIVLDRWFPLWL